MAETVLVVAAHPDDEVLGCGATAARLAREGHAVHIAILGEGITSRHARREDADPAELAALHAQARRAAEVMGAASCDVHDFPDNRFDTVPLLDIVRHVEGVVTRLRPSVIYTHHGGDLNVDHALTHRAVLTATRPMAGRPVREILAFEVPSSTEWAFGQLARPFQPDVWVDVAATLETKVAALRVYDGETRAFPHPRSPEALRALAQRHGSTVGLPAAEAFDLVRSIR